MTMDSARPPAAISLAEDRSQPLLEPKPSETSLESGAAAAPTSIMRRVSAFVVGSREETMKCQVCFNDVPLSQTVILSSCAHRHCRECITLYLEVKIRDGQVYPKCFHQLEELQHTVAPTSDAPLKQVCGDPISDDDIEILVSRDVRAKFKAFRFNKENSLGRECPFCNHQHICKGPEDPVVKCTKCPNTFCFLHSNAHVGKSSADYEKREIHNELQSRAIIQKTAKPCPKCQADIEKSGGCNHLRCPTCDTNFCWLCGIQIESESTTNHFEWWRMGSCSDLRHIDVRQDMLAHQLGARLITLFHFLVIGPTAAVVTAAFTLGTFFCLPCVCCLDMTFRTSVFACMEITMWLLFLPIRLLFKGLMTCMRYMQRRLCQRLPRQVPQTPQPHVDVAQLV